MGEATNSFGRAHKHLLYDKASTNTRPVTTAVSDNMCLGKLGPILWLSFFRLYHFYHDERYDFGTPVMSCLGMSFSFNTEDMSGMSFEIDGFFFSDCQFTLILCNTWRGT